MTSHHQPDLFGVAHGNEDVRVRLHNEQRAAERMASENRRKDAAARRTDPPTSHVAAAGADTNRLEGAVMGHLKIVPGATIDELVDALGMDKVSLSPRMKPLEMKGKVRRGGTRPGHAGRPQTIWIAI